MLPTERCDVLQQLVGNISAPLVQKGRCPAEIDGVPMDDGADHKVEAGSTECLTVKGAITDFAALVEKDGTLELVRGFALVESGLTAPPQRWAGIPFDHEQRALDTAEFAQRFGQIAGFRRRGELLEDRRWRDGARCDRGGKAQEFVPMFHNERGVDRHADMICQGGIGISLLKGVEFSVFYVAKPWREALADQAEQRKDMIARPAGIREQLLDLQNGVVVEQAVEHIDGLTFGRANRQDAIITVLASRHENAQIVRLFERRP